MLTNYEYIKVTYKSGYIHYYLTNDVESFRKDPDVASVELVTEDTNID
jgi:hypothetical protein